MSMSLLVLGLMVCGATPEQIVIAIRPCSAEII